METQNNENLEIRAKEQKLYDFEDIPPQYGLPAAALLGIGVISSPVATVIGCTAINNYLISQGYSPETSGLVGSVGGFISGLAAGMLPVLGGFYLLKKGRNKIRREENGNTK